ncbi:hypothetical protein SAMN05444673_3929 [Bacillus sp. OV166]|uniref:hypothetical protein n=1 Tax=Bacillus sp. OV166 TaxID=1882763 RepID=UPI000A2AA61B|nr:hypothetical protein [Bacillus sp. OV166]SMQ80588.1 hypothetical protein SAMN05444673_3929 [Bacillus sp. OV166]
MALFIGSMLIVWGGFILFSSLFRMKSKDYKDIGISGFIEWDLLFKLLSKLPPRVYKSFVLLTGVAFIVLGIVIVL